jgi:hypothetical protein
VNGESSCLILATPRSSRPTNPAATAPEGFYPPRQGLLAARGGAALDLAPNVNARTISLKVDVSPSGSDLPVPVAAPAGANGMPDRAWAPDREEGVWLRFAVGNGFAGSAVLARERPRALPLRQRPRPSRR